MRALVTGASHGIGGATCRKLAQDGLARGERVRIAATATGTRPDLDELVAELNEMGASAVALTGDLADPSVPGRLVAQALEFCGGLDALVSNAAMRHQAPLLDLQIEHWDSVFAVNARATWLLGRAAHAALAESTGAIVAVSSIAGMYPHANYGPYAASKAALVMICQQMAQEWGPDGIRVNCVAPGMVRTRNAANVYADPVLAAERAERVPLRRVADPSELAGAIAMLLSPDASYITGQNICVDGGFTASVMATIPGRPAAR
ncbi:MAG: 3-oxoacyl-[acyl-carrier protein] reductase [Acidimicrobiaceae bacterium]